MAARERGFLCRIFLPDDWLPVVVGLSRRMAQDFYDIIERYCMSEPLLEIVCVVKLRQDVIVLVDGLE